MIGRTHGVHAEPTTFGLKLAGWAFALERDRVRVERALEGMRVGKLSGAVGTYAAVEPEVERVACERLGLEAGAELDADPAARPPRRGAERARAPRCVAGAVRARAPPPRPDRGTRGRGALRERPEGVVGDAAQAEPDRVRADLRARPRRPRPRARPGSRTWRSGTSATSPTRRRSGSCFPTPSSSSTTCSTGSPGSSKGWSSASSGCARTSTRATGSSSASGCCSRSSSRGSPGTRRTGSSSGTRCAPGTRGSTSPTLVRADAEIAAASTSTQVFDDERVHAACRRRLRPAARASAGSTSMPDAAVHLGSGKVRELYALDDERLLLVASDRISTFDVVLPTEVPDKGRVLTGLSAFWFARTREHRSEPPARAPRRRPLARLQASRDAAGGDRRPRLPGRVGLEGLRRDGRRLRARAAARPRRVGPAPGADRDAGDEGTCRPRREHRRADRRRARRRRALGRG